MTIGVPDYQDPRQPQPSNDLLYSGHIAVGSSILATYIDSASGIYPYIVALFTPHNGLQVNASLATTYGPNPFTLQRYMVAGTTSMLVFPTAGFLGYQPYFSVTTTPAVATANLTIEVYGYRVFPGGLRYDGLYLPQNSQSFVIPATTGSSAAGPVLSTPERILIGVVIPPAVIVETSPGVGVIEATVGGVTTAIATGAGAVGDPMEWNVPQIGQGILCDPGTTPEVILPPVSLGEPGALYYDVVV